MIESVRRNGGRIAVRCAVSVVLVACACGKREAAADSGKVVATHGVTAVADTGAKDPGIPSDHVYPGTVPNAADKTTYTLPDEKPIATYVSGTGPKRFYDFTRSRAWHGWSRPRACDANDDCVETGGETVMAAEAIEGSQDIKASDVVTYDRVIGRVFSYRDKDDHIYKKCNTKGAKVFECYIVVTAGSKVEQLARLTIKNPGTSTETYALAVEPLGRTYGQCGTSTDLRIQSEGDLKTCGDRADGPLPDHSRGHAPWTDGPKSLFWMACNEGCCS